MGSQSWVSHRPNPKPQAGLAFRADSKPGRTRFRQSAAELVNKIGKMNQIDIVLSVAVPADEKGR